MRTTTPTRLHLPPDIVADLRSRAEAAGCTVDELVATTLLDELPGLLAEAATVGLRASLGRAEPVEAHSAPKTKVLESTTQGPMPNSSDHAAARSSSPTDDHTARVAPVDSSEEPPCPGHLLS